MDIVTIKNKNDELLVDFSNRYVILEQRNKKINFSDITGIEFSKPNFLLGATVSFIVKGKKYMVNDLTFDVFLFCAKKEDSPALESCMTRLAKELHVSIKSQYNAPKVAYTGEFDYKKHYDKIQDDLERQKNKEKRRVKNRNIGLIIMAISFLAILIACTSTKLAALAVVSVFVGFIGFLLFAYNIKPPEKLKEPKSSSGTKAIVKGAVIGSVVAGDVGAVVGAVAAKNKIDNQNK